MARMAEVLFSLFLAVMLAGCSVTLDNDHGEYLIGRDNSGKGRTHVFDDKIVLSLDTTSIIEISKVSRWMAQINGEKSNQGADCFRNYLCQYRADHTSLDILDMQQKRHVATIPLVSLGNAFHCNNADFSNLFYDESDAFPLLFSSHQGKEARCVLVDRVFKEGDEYKIETLQRIEIPYYLDEPLQYTPDALFDKDNQYLYVYTGNTVPLTYFYIYKFRLPTLVKGTVSLAEEDIEAVWVIKDNPPKYKQGGTIKNGVLYLMEGVPGWHTDNILRVIDLNTGSYSIFNLTKRFNAIWEPEDVFWYDDGLFIAANRTGIYRVEGLF